MLSAISMVPFRSGPATGLSSSPDFLHEDFGMFGARIWNCFYLKSGKKQPETCIKYPMVNHGKWGNVPIKSSTGDHRISETINSMKNTFNSMKNIYI